MKTKVVSINNKLQRGHRGRNDFVEKVLSNNLANMYMQDSSNDVLPYPYREKKNKFTAIIRPNDNREPLSFLFHFVGKDRSEFEESLATFFERTSQDIILYGRSIYELCDVQTDSGVCLALQSVYPDSIKVGHTKAIQSINGEAEVSIDRDRLLVIPEPSFTEGGRGFRATLETLIRETKRGFTPASLMESQSRGELSAFDWRQFREGHESRVLSGVRASGWNARNLFNDSITEYYLVYRVLKFRMTSAILREHILAVLNQFLTTTQQFGLPKTQITLDGILGSGEISALMKRLENGEIPFRTIIDSFY